MADWGIWSYQVMMFERDDAARSAASTITRPMRWSPSTPTISRPMPAGARSAISKLKRSLGIDPGETDDARWHALTMLGDVLRHHAIDGHDLYAVAAFLARTRRGCWRYRWRICSG